MIGLTDVLKNSETGGRGNGGFHGDTAHCEKRSLKLILLISISRFDK